MLKGRDYRVSIIINNRLNVNHWLLKRDFSKK